MSGQEDIRKVAKQLEEIYQGLHDDPPGLEKMVRQVSEASQIYGKFRERLEQAQLEVQTLKRTPEGMQEEPFDWRALYGEEGSR